MPATFGAIQAWHLFTGIGAGLAVFNTGFLIWDRMFRYRPIVSVTALQGWTGGGHATPTLRVKNVAPFDIVIERFSIDPPHCTISADTEIRALVDALVRADVPILLEPQQERQLIIVVGDREKIRHDKPITISIEWRRGHSSWLRQWPVKVRTSIDDIELRERAALNARGKG